MIVTHAGYKKVNSFNPSNVSRSQNHRDDKLKKYFFNSKVRNKMLLMLITMTIINHNNKRILFPVDHQNPCVDLCHRNLAFDAEEETDSRYGVDIEAAERANQADQTENHSVPTQPRRAQNDVKNPQSDVERPANPPPYQAQIVVKNPQSDAGRLPNPPLRHAESDVKIPQSDAEKLAIPLGFSVDNELINPQSSARSHSPRQHTETPIREILTKHTNS